MSWWVGMEVNVGAEQNVCLGYERNVTYNLSPMFYGSINYKEGLKYLDGKYGKDCVPVLKVALGRMIKYKADYIKLNPKNGWGDYGVAVDVIKEMLDWCQKMPKAKMYVH